MSRRAAIREGCVNLGRTGFDRLDSGYLRLVNVAEVLHLKVSDALRMNVSDLLRTDLSARRLPPHRDGPPPGPALMRFEPEIGAPAEARSFARTTIEAWAAGGFGVEALGEVASITAELIDKAEFVVSEFVSATIGAGSGGAVVLRCLEDGVHVEVTADDADFDDADRSTLAARVVEGASTSWGVSYTWPRWRSLWSDITV